jgi:hypothetical protein
MAALDFGMALSRGMLPKSSKAQQDLLDLAGGRNVFKSEDWWSKAVDKQISSGYRESEKGTEYMTKSGQYALGTRTVSRSHSNVYGIGGGTSISYQAPEDALITGYTQPSYSGGFWGLVYGGGGGPSPIYKTREVDVYGQSGRKDFTAGELKDIEVAAKAGASRAKQETAQSEASQRRLRRGTGGLVAKALVPGAEGIDTGLPALGQTGLGLGTSMLGKGFTL